MKLWELLWKKFRISTLWALTSHFESFWSTVLCLTWLISLKSWDTRTSPPSKLLMASPKASMVSISKWLVGSSSNNMWGVCQANHANTTLHLWPSESCLIGAVWRKKMGWISKIQSNSKGEFFLSQFFRVISFSTTFEISRQKWGAIF